MLRSCTLAQQASVRYLVADIHCNQPPPPPCLHLSASEPALPFPLSVWTTLLISQITEVVSGDRLLYQPRELQCILRLQLTSSVTGNQCHLFTIYLKHLSSHLCNSELGLFNLLLSVPWHYFVGWASGKHLTCKS